MTSRLRSIKQVVARAALISWCALTAVIPAADAAAERASAGARAHIEAAGGGANCIPAHDHTACQLCRVLRLASNGTAAAPALVILRASSVPQTAQVVSLPGKRVERNSTPRAPPLA